MKPTVSDIRKGRLSKTTLRTVVSSVAKSLFSAKTSLFEIRFISVDFPTLVYPTSATRTSAPRFERCTAICRSIFFRSSFSFAMRLRMMRRSVSISRSPAPPRVPVPPRCRSRWVQSPERRGSMYS